MKQPSEQRVCPHCGETISGHFWGGVALLQHKWEVHGIPGETTLNGKKVFFPPKQLG